MANIENLIKKIIKIGYLTGSSAFELSNYNDIDYLILEKDWLRISSKYNEDDFQINKGGSNKELSNEFYDVKIIYNNIKFNIIVIYSDVFYKGFCGATQLFKILIKKSPRFKTMIENKPQRVRIFKCLREEIILFLTSNDLTL